MGYYVGVDLGTTFTAAAVWRDGRVELSGLGTRAPVVPSVVLAREDGATLVGEPAERRGVAEPERVAREFKRRVGDPTPLILGGAPYPAAALVARLLSWVVERVGEAEGGPPDGIVVCHPANWGDFKKDVLHQAIARADLAQVATTVTEPEAAAIHYASQERVAPGSVVAVYDLGGGTFDAAVLRRRDTGPGWEIVGEPQGVEHLGGVDFDEAVFRHVTGTLGGAMDTLDLDDPASMAAVARLRRDCVEAKEALSSDTDVAIPVLLPSLQTEVRLTRSEFEEMVRPSLVDSVAALRRAMRSAGIAPEDVHTVLLVGGSSRIPLVAELVGSELRRPVAVDAHPKHGTALGAAMLAGQRGAEGAGGTDGVVTSEVRQTEDRSPAPAPIMDVPEPAPAPPAPLADISPPPAAPADGESEGPRRVPGRALIGAGIAVALVAGLVAWQGLSGDGGGERTETGGSGSESDGPCAEGDDRTVTELEDVTIPAVEVPEQRVDDVEVGEQTIPGFTVEAVHIEERVVDAGCIIEYDAPDGCLGAVEITPVEIPGVEVDGYEIPAAPGDGGGFAGVTIEGVQVEPVSIAGARVEQVCPDDSVTSISREAVTREAAYRESLYREGSYRDSLCVGDACTEAISVPSLSIPSVSVDSASVSSASLPVVSG
jgi:actin-like ATPase involved in cell morphogenesis